MYYLSSQQYCYFLLTDKLIGRHLYQWKYCKTVRTGQLKSGEVPFHSVHLPDLMNLAHKKPLTLTKPIKISHIHGPILSITSVMDEPKGHTSGFLYNRINLGVDFSANQTRIRRIVTNQIATLCMLVPPPVHPADHRHLCSRQSLYVIERLWACTA